MAEPTKAELNKRVKELEAELEKAQKAMQEPMPAAQGIHVSKGFLITTEVPTYSGVTAGINFQNGMSFVPWSEGAEEIVNLLQTDFTGYTVTLLEGEALVALQKESPEAALKLAAGIVANAAVGG